MATMCLFHELYVKVDERFVKVNTTFVELLYTTWAVFSRVVSEGVKIGEIFLSQIKHTVDSFRRGIEEIAKDMEELLDFVFMNDDSPTQTVLDSYGTENLEKMRVASAKYDPDGVFQTLQNYGVLPRNI
ncbi:hypothetical protein F4821DRAFT_264456 [Hypoxylon rubiginosum]|uniref:Uncharacterized protein n=1 Tax=Hypoxylon rubiginosum TaxID=110542 RepID=A0ACC0CNK5_9PEZI|nr:hypothetical protein F4821DRAFT_264456 [Hypoxylon rubiginosum]